jgi:hypothetical protein
MKEIMKKEMEKLEARSDQATNPQPLIERNQTEVNKGFGYLVSGIWKDHLNNKWSYLVTTFDYDTFALKVVLSGGKILKKVVLE